MNVELIQYQNAHQSYDEVINNFIVRQKEFDRVMDDIRSTQDGSSFQHYVYVGKRGSGKSTLLRRIQAEIEHDKKLKAKYIAVNLSEELSGVYRLYDLWDYVIRDFNENGYGIPHIDFRLYKHDMKAYTKALHLQVITVLQSHKKKLILLVDNIDRVLNTRGSDDDAALLRELLMNFKDIRIIGGSTVMSEQFWKYDMPFYEFFSIKRLEALSIEEVKKLLMHWSKIKKLPEIEDLLTKYPGKIQSIRMLTDGMPRTMLLFVDMLINRPEQHGYHYLQLLVDRATPIYQERLATLSPAQNKVLTELAFFWDAASVDQLIPRCKMDGKTVSALLNQLTQSRHVEKIKGNTKNLLYRLEERFFNLWFNMTQGGPQQRHEAKALTDFLEQWYEKTELNNLSIEFSSFIKKGEIRQDYAESMSLALLRSKKINKENKQKLYLDVKKSGLVEANKLNEPEQFFGNIEEAIKKAYDNKDFQKAIEILYISDIDNGRKYFELGLCYDNLENYFEAEKNYLLAVKNGIIDAIYSLSIIYYRNNDKAKLKNLINDSKSQAIDAIRLFSEKYHEFAMLLYLYLGDMEKFQEMSGHYLNEADTIVSDSFILSLLIHKQTNWVSHYFQTNEAAKERYKSLYYVTLMLQAGQEQELLKMPPEIKENVEDVIATIKEQQKFYYG